MDYLPVSTLDYVRVAAVDYLPPQLMVGGLFFKIIFNPVCITMCCSCNVKIVIF